MTRNAIQIALKRQSVQKNKMDKIYADVKRFTNDKKVADNLIEKYGVECAYSIVRQCMQEPGNVVKRINPQATIYKTSDVIKYIAEANLSDAKVASAIKKTPKYVANSKKGRNTSLQAQTSQARVSQRTERRLIIGKQVTRSNDTTPPSILRRPVTEETKPHWERMLNNNSFGLLKPQKTAEEQVADEFARLKRENPNGVTLGTLKDEGFGAGINNQVITPDMFKYLHAGKDGQGLGSAVKQATNQVRGENQCGAAVRIGYTNYMNKNHDANVPRNEAEFYGRRNEKGEFEWGSYAAQTLYKKFDSKYFTVLSYPNEGNNKGLNNVPDGTTIFYEGKAGRRLDDGTPHPGHTATYCAGDDCWYAGNYNQSKSKINNGAGYGKRYRVAIANDTRVDDELLKQIIREQIRQNEWQKNNCVLRNSCRGRSA